MGKHFESRIQTSKAFCDPINKEEASLSQKILSKTEEVVWPIKVFECQLYDKLSLNLYESSDQPETCSKLCSNFSAEKVFWKEEESAESFQSQLYAKWDLNS